MIFISIKKSFFVDSLAQISCQTKRENFENIPMSLVTLSNPRPQLISTNPTFLVFYNMRKTTLYFATSRHPSNCIE